MLKPHTFSTCLLGNSLHQGLEMIPVLEKTYNKALSQPSQIPAVVEALSTFCLFLKLYTLDAEAGIYFTTLCLNILSMLRYEIDYLLYLH